MRFSRLFNDPWFGPWVPKPEWFDFWVCYISGSWPQGVL